MAPDSAQTEPTSGVVGSEKHPTAQTSSPHSSPHSPGSNGDPQHWDRNQVVNQIEPDTSAEDDPEDDGYESGSGGASTASTSLSSSINDYIFENNRRYHRFKEGRYLLPNDEVEQNREDMKHCMVKLLCNNELHFAPLENPRKMLDLGTGTGIWAIEMGDRYPGTEVVGVDLSPIQSDWVPPNVKFFIDDVEADWVDSEGSLDYVHLRHMGMAIKDWPRLLHQAYTALRPGGWIEFQDLRLSTCCDDDSMPPSYGVSEFLSNLADGFSALGYNLLSLEHNQSRLEEAGFINVREMIWKVPIGVWPKDRLMKEVGMYNREVLAEALQGVSMGPYTRGLGWTAAEVEVFLTRVRKSLADSNVHSYYTFHVVYGQKPDR